MLKTLWYKELRETLGVAAVALLAYAAIAAYCSGYVVLPILENYRLDNVPFPFLDGSFSPLFGLVSACLAIALGLRQTAVESGRGTWLFLLHRPAALRQLLGTKLLAGTVVYLVTAAIGILIYTAWAATPGTHASPFAWWMTIGVWKLWLAITLVYLGAFLAGLRPARWYGTRLLPMAAAGIFAVPVAAAAPWSLNIAVLVVVATCLVSLIYFVGRERDYS